MPAKKPLIRTKYPGVYQMEGKAVGKNESELIFYIVYRRKGKLIHEKAGRQYQDDMTAYRASLIRAKRIEGKEPSNSERRLKEKQESSEMKNRWTVDKIFMSYMAQRQNGKSKDIDKHRYNKYLKPLFGEKLPNEILYLDIERLKSNVSKNLSPQTVLHILNLLTWIVNYGYKINVCNPLEFKIQKPKVQNQIIEDLTKSQFESLLDAIKS
ncbi:MAG: site-specific integrase, partial [Desulfobacterales bacterium]